MSILLLYDFKIFFFSEDLIKGADLRLHAIRRAKHRALLQVLRMTQPPIGARRSKLHEAHLGYELGGRGHVRAEEGDAVEQLGAQLRDVDDRLVLADGVDPAHPQAAEPLGDPVHPLRPLRSRDEEEEDVVAEGAGSVAGFLRGRHGF